MRRSEHPDPDPFMLRSPGLPLGPTLLVFKLGKIISGMSGAHSHNQQLEILNQIEEQSINTVGITYTNKTKLLTTGQ